MNKLFFTFLLLLSCVSLSAQVTEKCTQLPMPDVLAKMIVESVSIDEYNSDKDCHDIQFRECNTLADLLGRGQDEEAGYPVEELINQLKTNSKGYIFYTDFGDENYKSLRHFMRKKRVKLPASVVSVCISSSTEDEVSILCYPLRYERRRVWVSGDLANEHIWAYDTTLRRYNLRQIDGDYLDGSVSVDAPVSFYDILKHISEREYRHIDVHYGDERDVFDMQRPMYLGTKMNREHHMRLAIAVDELDLVNYQSDTICIRYSYSQWNMSGNIYTNPYSRYSLNFKCNKGLYWLEDYRLEPVVGCDEEERKNDEIVRQKYFPERDVLPFSYDWAMLRYTCWDDKKILRNFGPISDYFESLIRIIIKDGRVVYCDSWDW